jgi:hypothetical protein
MNRRRGHRQRSASSNYVKTTYAKIETVSVSLAGKSKPKGRWNVPWTNRMPHDVPSRVLRQF